VCVHVEYRCILRVVVDSSIYVVLWLLMYKGMQTKEASHMTRCIVITNKRRLGDAASPK
jgi:hypothetical protein